MASKSLRKAVSTTMALQTSTMENWRLRHDIWRHLKPSRSEEIGGRQCESNTKGSPKTSMRSLTDAFRPRPKCRVLPDGVNDQLSNTQCFLLTHPLLCLDDISVCLFLASGRGAIVQHLLHDLRQAASAADIGLSKDTLTSRLLFIANKSLVIDPIALAAARSHICGSHKSSNFLV